MDLGIPGGGGFPPDGLARPLAPVDPPRRSHPEVLRHLWTGPPAGGPEVDWSPSGGTGGGLTSCQSKSCMTWPHIHTDSGVSQLGSSSQGEVPCSETPPHSARRSRDPTVRLAANKSSINTINDVTVRRC